MLKDLDKRQAEQQNSANVVLPGSSKSSTAKLIVIIVSFIVLLNISILLAWNYYSESQPPKLVQQPTLKTANNLVETVQKQASSSTIDELKKPELAAKPTVQTPENKKLDTIEASTTKQNISNEPSSFSRHVIKDTGTQNTNTQPSKVSINKLPDRLVDSTKETLETLPKQVSTEAKSSLTISRTQLSPQALAANKITEAEQAIERNDILKAESLFEEVLLVLPGHETARKQLAALWYGKKHYQNAVNLLSQGIALSPDSQEMRLMSARIYYEQGQAREALNILSPVNYSMSKELQTLLASVAAELNEHDTAIVAYRKLITLEPNIGRWLLGLAVSLDSLGKFAAASDAYKQAIARKNLSTSAAQFARQRLIELGE